MFEFQMGESLKRHHVGCLALNEGTNVLEREKGVSVLEGVLEPPSSLVLIIPKVGNSPEIVCLLLFSCVIGLCFCSRGAVHRVWDTRVLPSRWGSSRFGEKNPSRWDRA